MQLQILEIRSPNDLESAFEAASRDRADALISFSGALLESQRQRIVDLAAKSWQPGIYNSRQWVTIGGLMSDGPDTNDQWRHAATYVDKILKGTKPADLPVEQPTIFEFVINLKTAKALGLTIPQSVLARATEVIQ